MDEQPNRKFCRTGQVLHSCSYSFAIECLTLFLLLTSSLSAASPGPSQGTVNGPNSSEQTSKKLVSAKTVYLMTAARNQRGEGQSRLWGQKLANADAAMKELTKAIEKWGRFVIVVDDPKRADLVLLVMEWEDAHRWGKEIACRDQLFVFDGGGLPNEKSEPLWTGDPERWGKWGGCSGAGQPVKELRKQIEKTEKTAH